MTDQTGHTPQDPTGPLSFTAPTPPAFTPPPAPAPAADLDPQPPEQGADEDEHEPAAAPTQHPDAPGYGVTDKFPVPSSEGDE
jgi:hypothetical protein